MRGCYIILKFSQTITKLIQFYYYYFLFQVRAHFITYNEKKDHYRVSTMCLKKCNVEIWRIVRLSDINLFDKGHVGMEGGGGVRLNIKH